MLVLLHRASHRPGWFGGGGRFDCENKNNNDMDIVRYATQNAKRNDMDIGKMSG